VPAAAGVTVTSGVMATTQKKKYISMAAKDHVMAKINAWHGIMAMAYRRHKQAHIMA